MDYRLTVPGSFLNARRPSESKNDELRFWLKCRNDSGKGLCTKAQLLKREILNFSKRTLFFHLCRHCIK